MSEIDDNTEISEGTKAKKKKKERGKKERIRKERVKKERVREGKVRESSGEFFRGIWKVISFFLKIIFAPFWFTVALFIKAIKFLRERSDNPLSKEDKSYLSIIPSLFFMMSISIIIVFVILYTGVLDSTVDLITSAGLGQAIADFFVRLGNGIYNYILIPVFVTFLWGMIIEPFGQFITSNNFFWGTLILILILIFVIGLSIIFYHLMKTRKLIKAIARFFKRIFRFPRDVHDWIRERIVLKHIVGQKYVDTNSKNFFWRIVLIQFIITIILFIIAITLGVINYIGLIPENGGVVLWRGESLLQYSLVVGGILFFLIGIFSTWFFVRVFGIAIKVSESAE
jgi:hypothetical protein